MSFLSSPNKPSPLSLGSARASAFTRPDSPLSRSPSRNGARTPAVYQDLASSPSSSPSRTVRASSPPQASSTQYVAQPRQNGTAMSSDDPISRLDPTRLREMRESFQVLDRDNDGQVGRDDVAEMLKDLGQDHSLPALSPFFPTGAQQTTNLSAYLHSLATLLAPLSSADELTNAFAAFDVDDSGQIDVDDLRDALLHTPREGGSVPIRDVEIDQVIQGFAGRRVFAKNRSEGAGRRGDVFRYQDFIDAVMGGKDQSGQGMAIDA